MKAVSRAQRDSARKELAWRANHDTPVKFKSMSDDALNELANTDFRDMDVPDRIHPKPPE
jgi:hypothetical protein